MHYAFIIVSYSIGIGPSKEQTFTPKSDHRKRKKGLSQITSLRFKTLTNAVLIFRAFKAANVKASQVEEQKEKRFEILLCGLQFSPQSDACHNIFGLVYTIS